MKRHIEIILFRFVIVVCILVIAAFLRLYNIAGKTEYLGDQGRMYADIYEAVKTRQVRLVGATTSNGIWSGPAYYYFIGLPFILSGYDPVIPAIEVALLGVIAVWLLYYITYQLFGLWPAVATAILYALSPSIVSLSRNSWVPTPIPFFALLWFISFYFIHEKRRHVYYLLFGLTAGILLSIHYSTIYVVLASIALFFWELMRSNEQHKKRHILFGLFGGLCFIITQVPFLLFEYANEFKDIRELVLMVLFRPSGVEIDMSTRPPGLMATVARIYWYLSSGINEQYLGVVGLIPVFLVLFRLNIWTILSAALFLGGALFIGSLRSVLHNHYIFFLFIPAYILIANSLDLLLKRLPILFVPLITAAAIFFLARSDISSIGVRDITRTQEAVTAMIEEASGQPFAFTLLESQSFSDYHYRFFFLRYGVTPSLITEKNYHSLFLICDNPAYDVICPSIVTLLNKRQIPVLCYDKDCKGPYPSISLSDWNYKTYKNVGGTTVYLFKRGLESYNR